MSSDDEMSKEPVSNLKIKKDVGKLSNRHLKRLLNSALSERETYSCPKKKVGEKAAVTVEPCCSSLNKIPCSGNQEKTFPADSDEQYDISLHGSVLGMALGSSSVDNWNCAAAEVLTLTAADKSCANFSTMNENDIAVECGTHDDFDTLRGNEQSFEKFLSICDECNRCGSCVCLIECGECTHDESVGCKHCSKCDDFFSVSAAEFVESTDDLTEPHVESVSSDTGDGDNGSSSLCEDLAEWAVNQQITHACLKELLEILEKHHPEDHVPRDPRTLLGTARNVPVREVPPGLYWHNGVKKNLISMYSDLPEQEIKLGFNVDGVPISNSSGSVLWPILCNVVGTSDVFVAGIYHGHAKPLSESVYLEDFVKEMRELVSSGLDIGGKHFQVSLSCCACDAPAKAFILNTKGHNGYFSCKCYQKGSMCGNRMCFPETDFVVRTDESFILQEQPGHHLPGDPPSLLSIPDFKPVSNVVLDPLHLLYLGVMKKLIMFWLFGSRSVKMGKTMCDQISALMVQLQPFVPVEFQRKPRPLMYVCKFKGNEFREILYYIGPVIFRKLNEKIYSNFLTLHVAARLLCSPDTCVKYNVYAGELMKNFVNNFKLIYGEEYVSHNVHGCLHVNQDVMVHGPLELYSVYKYENFLQKIKNLVRKGEKPLQQIAKRYSEMEAVMMRDIKNRNASLDEKLYVQHNSGPVVEGCGFPQFKVCKLGTDEINVNREGDSCVSLKDGSIVLVKNFAHHHESGKMRVIGMKFKDKANLYTAPVESSSIGIFKVSGLGGLRSWPIEQLSRKLFRMPFKKGIFAVVPLLH